MELIWGFHKNEVDSFLFSMERKEKYMIKMEGSINYNLPSYGPIFGRGFDLVVGEKVSSFFSSNQNWSKFPNSYGDNSDNNIKGALTGGNENFLVTLYTFIYGEINYITIYFIFCQIQKNQRNWDLWSYF